MSNYTSSNADISKNFIKTLEEDANNAMKLKPPPSWNKLDKIKKKNKLFCYAEKFALENKYNASELKMLKMFFLKTLEKGKLNKIKEVNYSVETQDILSIPGLFFNQTTKNFTLRNMDPKHVSTLKSLPSKNGKQKIE